MAGHENCTNNAYKPVTCDRCGRSYVCTPDADFYCAAEGDHCCESCLLLDRGISKIITLTPADLSSAG
jgi:hypothetical protein